MGQAFRQKLDPYAAGTRTDEKIPVRQYVNRVSGLLPNFPRDVIIQWLYRHYEWFIDDYRWLDFARLKFDLQEWPTERVVAEITACDESWVEDRRSGLFSDPHRSALERSMLRRGTWPRPVIVLDNANVPRAAAKVLGRYHLLEGHRRLGYLRALSDHGQAQPKHRVWLVSWVPTATSHATAG